MTTQTPADNRQTPEQAYAEWQHLANPQGRFQHDAQREAAAAIAPKFGRMTTAVLALIARYGDGLTDEEGQSLMNLEGNSYRPCRVTLADKGFVHDTNLRRMTKSRKKATVWGISQAGIDYLTTQGV